jgi:hypothetical protein
MVMSNENSAPNADALRPANPMVAHQEPASPKMSGFFMFLALILGIYIVGVALVSIVCIWEIYFDKLNWVAGQGITLPDDMTLRTDLRLALLAGTGAILGGCLLCFLGLFRHVVLVPEFNARFFGSYLIGPWAVFFLGLTAYVLVRAGLLAFGGVQDVSEITSANELSYLALGLLVGFAWNRVLMKLAALAEELFSSNATRPQIATRLETPPPAGSPQQKTNA